MSVSCSFFWLLTFVANMSSFHLKFSWSRIYSQLLILRAYQHACMTLPEHYNCVLEFFIDIWSENHPIIAWCICTWTMHRSWVTCELWALYYKVCILFYHTIPLHWISDDVPGHENSMVHVCCFVSMHAYNEWFYHGSACMYIYNYRIQINCS